MSELGAPLRRRRARQARSATDTAGQARRRIPVARVALGLLAMIGLGVAARVLLVDDPEGGRPSATVEISTAAANPVAGAVATGALPATITADPESFPAGSVPPQTGVPPAPLDPAAIVADLVEETQFGPLPKLSAAGERPFDAYARPSTLAAGQPSVAVIVSGLGLNLDGTLEAIDKLPEDVTLAFAPYGKTLDRTTAAARSDGHEILLEVPLEPFDYPENDPGPDTLLTGQPPRDNLDKLFRVMSRFGGYAGLINNMGARFTASGADFGPMMEELGARGLGYVDDGSSNRSLAPQLARANRVPFARVDLVLDSNPARAPIMAALDALEDKARQNGAAVGIVSALPVSIEAVSEWAAGLAGKGIALVPTSALMGDD